MRQFNADASAFFNDFAKLFNQFNYEEPYDFTGPEYYIGIMSGTSMDGVDAALIEMQEEGMTFIKGVSLDYTDEEKALFHEGAKGNATVQTAGRIGVCYAKKAGAAVKKLLQEASMSPSQIKAIGSHGQTLWHAPAEGFSIQASCSATLASDTGIDVVSDFRSADIAAGGQGAPLTPLFHRIIFAKLKTLRMVVNIGGITNITCLRPDFAIECGFDSGPGNTLVDLVCRKFFDAGFDEDAKLALQGNLNEEQLKTLLSHPYFKLKPPKSTGRELFNEDFICRDLEQCQSRQDKLDLLHTLCALTGYSAADAILKLLKTLPPQKLLKKDPRAGSSKLKSSYPCEVVLCGGGACNPLTVRYFAQRLEDALKLGYSVKILKSSDLGISEKYIEAQAFAYFAYQHVHKGFSDLRSVTGSGQLVFLGAFYPSTDGFHLSTP